MSDTIKVKVTKHAGRKYLIMYYDDPITGKREQRSTKQMRRREAEREAAKWEGDLRAGRYKPQSRITWEEFRERYGLEKLSGHPRKTQEAADSVFNHVERIINPKHLSSMNAATLSGFQAELRKTGLAETSIAGYLGHLRASLGWASGLPGRNAIDRYPQEIQRPEVDAWPSSPG